MQLLLAHLQIPPMMASQINLRRGRHPRSGQVYLVTFTSEHRSRHFSGWAVASSAARILSDPAHWQQSKLLAWVLMPDHWHGLIELGPGDTLAKRIGWIKSHSARELRRAHRDLGCIWAKAYHDHALRRDEDLLEVSRYLLLNPVRAGLAAGVGMYSFWDAVWLSG